MRYEITETVQQVITGYLGGANRDILTAGSASIAVKDLTGTNLTVYDAETGTGTLSNPLTADSSTGRIEGWVEAPDYDLAVSGAGITTYTQKIRTSPFFNVKSYGAKGDDTANDTAAIQAALDAAYAAGGGTLFIPDGIYLVTALSREWGANITVNIVGAGKRATLLKKTGATTTPILSMVGAGGGPWESYSDVRDLSMLGNATAHDGIKVTDLARFNIENVDIRSCAKGINYVGALVSRIVDCTLQSNLTGFYARQGAGVAPPNLVTISGGQFSNNTQWGIDYDDGEGLALEGGPDIELNGTAADTATGGLKIGSNTGDGVTPGHNSVSETWFEANLGRTISVLGGAFELRDSIIVGPESGRALYASGGSSLTLSNVDAPGPGGTSIVTVATQMRVHVENFIGEPIVLPAPAVDDHVEIINHTNQGDIRSMKATVCTGTEEAPTNIPYNSIFVDSRAGNSVRFRDSAGTVWWLNG